MTSPIPTSQVPGVYRMRVGDAVVTAVSDGISPANPATLQNITLPEASAILERAGRPLPTGLTINAFVVQTARRTVLIDTGYGLHGSPTTGRLMGNLQAAEIAATDIDVVLLTHMHRDHAGGLLNAEGKPAFPNATLLVPPAEAAYWLDEARATAAADSARPTFELVRNATAAYGSRMHQFTEREPVPGLVAMPLPGHTPGHTGYMIGNDRDGLLIWGDIVHFPDIQAYRPEAAIVFDVDQVQAIATRRAILARAADERLMVAGMHHDFPGFARVVRDGAGYAIRPIAWQPEL